MTPSESAQEKIQELSFTNDETVATLCYTNLITLIEMHKLTPEDLIPKGGPKHACRNTVKNALEIARLYLTQFYIRTGTPLAERAKKFSSEHPKGSITTPSAEEAYDLLLQVAKISKKADIPLHMLKIDTDTLIDLRVEIEKANQNIEMAAMPVNVQCIQ